MSEEQVCAERSGLGHVYGMGVQVVGYVGPVVQV